MSAQSLQKRYSVHGLSETRAYCRWINRALGHDTECHEYLPLDPYGYDIYEKVKDGIILCKLLNFSSPGAIDERTMNRGQGLQNYARKMENLLLVLTAARCRGCNMGKVDINDIYAGVKEATIDFIWQIIRIGFIQDVTIYTHPKIIELKKEGDSLDDLREQSPENIIVRYVNFHLAKSGMRNFVYDFFDDFRDCLVYAHLTYRVAPALVRSLLVTPTNVMRERSIEKRAKYIIKNLENLGADCFLTEDDLLNGFSRRDSCAKLHLSTMGYLFKHFDGDLSLHRPVIGTKLRRPKRECLEELTCRNFINSFNVYPFSNHILSDNRNGWIFGQMFEMLRPGYTSGIKFILEFDESRLYNQRVINCTKVVRFAQSYPMNIPGIDPDKIANSDKTIILNLFIEIMRAYTCLDKYSEKEIVDWTNCEVRKLGRRTMIKSFADKIVADENLFALLLEVVSPGLLDHSYFGNNKLLNAQYYVSMAHKAGIPIYTLPVHFAECNSVFVALAFANLMMHHRLSPEEV